jgi:hypothetical protein
MEKRTLLVRARKVYLEIFMPLEFVSAQLFQHRIKTSSLSPVAQRERETQREREDWGAERCHAQQDEKNMPNLTQYLQLLKWHSTFHQCIGASPYLWENH